MAAAGRGRSGRFSLGRRLVDLKQKGGNKVVEGAGGIMARKDGEDEIDIEGAVEFSKYIEEAMCEIVHHSTWSMETLIALILDKVTQSFLVGERVTLRGKKGTFKVLECDPMEGYTLQPASGGAPMTGVSGDEIVRPQGSQVNLLTPESIAAWLDFSADVRELESDEDECLWRMKKMYRDMYNLDGSIPERFQGKVTFPIEHHGDSEQDTYEPSEDDDAQEDDENEEEEVEEEEELEIEQPMEESDMKTRRKRVRQTLAGDPAVGGVDVHVLKSLQFDGVPLHKSVFAFLFETLADAEERMSSNEDKLAVFTVLKHVGQEGYSVDEIITAMAENNCALPEETSEARTYVMEVCNSDAAFFQRSPGKVCLSATITQAVVEKFVGIFEKCADETLPQPDKGRRASLESKIEARQIESLKRLADQFMRNVQKYQLKCPKCHRFVSSAKVKGPIRKCKTCPRAYHVECLDESELERSERIWSCEKCIDVAQGGLRKILDLEDKKDQKNRDIAAEKQKKLVQRGNPQTNKRSKDTRSGAKKHSSDLDVLEEQKKSVGVLKKQIDQLKKTGNGENNDLKQAQEELVRIQNEIEGPPKKYELLFTSPDAFATFNEASGIAEFLSLYGDICELEEILDTPELLLSTRWPLDQSSSIVPLYSQLLLCCLLEQLNRDPPMKSRARKWTRILTNATWPEVLRKYIKSTRVPSEKEMEEGIYEPIADLQGSSRGLYSDDFEMLKSKADDFLTNKGWWEMPAELQLSLLHALCYDISQGYTLKLDMSNKIQDCAKISTEFGKLMQQARRIRREKHQGDKKKTVNNDNGSDDDDENDDDDDLEEEIDMQVAEKQEETEESLASRSFRTEPLGSDRYGRRYWWLRGSQGIILIEDDRGKHAGMITSKEGLDNVMKRLIRKGPCEGNLLRRIKRFYKRLCASLSGEGLESSVIIDKIERPMPTDGRQKVRTLEDLSVQMMSDTLSEAKMKIDEILSEIATAEIDLASDLKGYRKTLRGFETPSEVCRFMLELEAILCTAGEGLPPYASNDDMDTFLGSEYAKKLPPIVYMDPQKEGKPESVKEEEKKASDEDADNAPGVSEGEVDHISALIQENPLFKALKPFIVQPSPVTCDDDYDCSEVEHTYLREKRMRKPARLWRSGRERAVWLKGVLQAAEAAATVGSTQATFSAYILGDRVNLLIERCHALEKEIARWEAEEQERQKAEILLEKEKSSQIKEARERPMMIRTGKAKTDSGVKVVLKLIGREPFPQGRNATTAMDVMAPEEDVAKCRWGYQCSVCLLAGDLICCEHKDGCAVSVHEDCSGQGFPEGKWICPNHDESNLKTRVRKRSEQGVHVEGSRNGRRSLVEPDPLADMMSSDEDDGKKAPDSRKRRMSDSATITDESSPDDDDSDYM